MLSGHGEIRVCLSRLTEGAKPRVDTAWRSEESWGWTQTFWSHCTEDTEATGLGISDRETEAKEAERPGLMWRAGRHRRGHL